jgi:hypothetical protein
MIIYYEREVAAQLGPQGFQEAQSQHLTRLWAKAIRHRLLQTKLERSRDD